MEQAMDWQITPRYREKTRLCQDVKRLKIVFQG